MTDAVILPADGSGSDGSDGSGFSSLARPGPQPVRLDVLADPWGVTVEAWLGSKTSNEHTRRAYRRQVDRFAEWCDENGIPSPADIRAGHLAMYRAEVTGDKTVGASSKRQAVAAVRSFLSWLRVWCPQLPDAGIMRQVFSIPGGQVERPYHVLNDGELAAVLDVAGRGSRQAGARNAAIIATMAGAGLRSQEVVRLTPADVTEGRSAVMIHVRQGKGEKDRTVPAAVDLAADLRRHLVAEGRTMGDPGDTAPIFRAVRTGRKGKHGPGRSLSTRAVRKMVRSVMKAAGVVGKDVSPHSLRHTFAVRFLEGGGDVRVLQKLLGHADLKTTMQYVDHLERAELAAALPALPRRRPRRR